MKKVLINVALGAMALAVVSVSCKKDEEEDKKIANPTASSATISGRIMANTDLRNDTNGTIYEKGQAGIKVIARASNKNLLYNADNNYEYADNAFTGETDADGNFSISVQTLNKGVDYTVYFSEYLAEQQQDTTGGVKARKETKRFFYNAGSTNVFVVPGYSKVLDVQYANN
jgi:hypothetical protein